MKIKVTQAQLKEMVDKAIKDNLETDVTEDLNLSQEDNSNNENINHDEFMSKLHKKEMELFGRTF